MAADETQSLEYKSIPNTYQSVVFVNNTNSIYSFYTGNGCVLPLSVNSKHISFDGDISVTGTLSSNNTNNIAQLLSNTSTFINFDGTAINNKSSITAATNNIDWNNPKSILTDDAVTSEYNKFSINLTPLMLDSKNISVSNDTDVKSVTVNLAEPATIVYIIPCLVNTESNSKGSSITLQATCNNISSNIAQLTINTYYEKWRDNPEALREEHTICDVKNNICTIIGYTYGVGGNNIIQILESGVSGISNWSIDENNILILSR